MIITVNIIIIITVNITIMTVNIIIITVNIIIIRLHWENCVFFNVSISGLFSFPQRLGPKTSNTKDHGHQKSQDRIHEEVQGSKMGDIF